MAFSRWSARHFVVDVAIVVVVVVVFSAYKHPEKVTLKKPPKIVFKQRCVSEPSQQTLHLKILFN